jgi:hypothetical protein
METSSSKPPGKKYSKWNIPPDVERHSIALCPDGLWIDCLVCKKWSPLNAHQYRINSRTPYSWGLFNQHLLKNTVHKENFEQNEVSKRIEARKQGKEVPPMKRQATLLSFCSKSMDNKTDDNAKGITTVVENKIINKPIVHKEIIEKGFLMKACLPKEKCRGIFEMKHFTNSSIQLGLEYAKKYYAKENGGSSNCCVRNIGDTTLMSIFSLSCEVDAMTQWLVRR